jgi:hypothetical protein
MIFIPVAHLIGHNPHIIAVHNRFIWWRAPLNQTLQVVLVRVDVSELEISSAGKALSWLLHIVT